MAENNNTFTANVSALMDGMHTVLSTKTVVGEAIHVGDNILLPLADVSFGVGVGSFRGKEKQNGAGGMGAKISPSAILVINGSGTRIINVKSQDALSKVLDMIPDLIARFTKKKGNDTCTIDEMEQIIHESAEAAEAAEAAETAEQPEK